MNTDLRVQAQRLKRVALILSRLAVVCGAAAAALELWPQ